MAEINSRSEEFNRTCLSEAFQTKTASYLTKEMSLELQCIDNWSRGDGLVFGLKDNVFSGGLMLRQLEADIANGDFMYSYFANYDQTTEDIHYMSALSSETSDLEAGYLVKHLELKANRESSSFELYFAGEYSTLGCGTQILSNGTEIFVKASVLSDQQNTADNCASSATTETLCLNASDLSELDTCTLTEADFTIEPVDVSSLFNSGEEIFNDIMIDNISEGLTDFNAGSSDD